MHRPLSFSDILKRMKKKQKRLRRQRKDILSRYDEDAVPEGVYSVLKGLEREIAYLRHEEMKHCNPV